MTIESMLSKLKSLELYLSAHPDNEEHSECADRLEDVQEIKSFIEESNFKINGDTLVQFNEG